MSAHDPEFDDTAPRLVRAYTITGGRTKAAVELPMEARVTLAPDAARREWSNPLARRIVDLDGGAASVVELSARLGQPLGVVRVVVGDLIQAGAARVEQTMTEDLSTAQRKDLMERTLRGLRAL